MIIQDLPTEKSMTLDDGKVAFEVKENSTMFNFEHICKIIIEHEKRLKTLEER